MYLVLEKFFCLLNRFKGNDLASDSFWALFGSALGKGLSLIAGVLIARFLGKDIYGQYGILKNTLLNIAVFSTLGLGYTGTRFIAKNALMDVSYIIKNILRITLIASAVIAFLVILYSNRIALFIKAPSLGWALRLTAVIIVFNAINTSLVGILSGFKAFKCIAKNNVFAGVVTFILSVLLSFIYGLSGALWALLISTLFNVAINYISVLSYRKEGEKRELAIVDVKELISFSIPIALQESLYTVVHFFSSILLITYGGYGELGITSAASQWSSVLLFFPSVMQNVILSYFSSAQSTLSLRKKMIIINGGATFFPWLCLALFSNVIASFYGSSYLKLNIVLIIMCANAIFSSISNVVVYEFVALGKNWQMFCFRFLRDLTSLLLAWLFLSSGIIQAQASIVSSFVYTLCGFLFMVVLLLLSSNEDIRKINNAEVK